MENKARLKKGEMLGHMIVLATNAHAGQFDKAGVPYILHPLAVMGMLSADDEERQCIAILHDVVEDTKITYQDLRDAGATDRVVAGVKALTKQPGQTYDEYQEEVFGNIDAMYVKSKDLTHNSDIKRLKGVTDKDIARIVKYHTFYLMLQERIREFELLISQLEQPSRPQ